MAKRVDCKKQIAPYYGAEHTVLCGTGYVRCEECLAEILKATPPAPRPPSKVEIIAWPCGARALRGETFWRHVNNCWDCFTRIGL